MASSRRRSARIQQKIIDSETSDINTTDDESTSLVSDQKRTPRRKSKSTPSKSTKNISHQVENIPPTVIELAEEETESTEIVEEIEEPKSTKKTRRRKKIICVSDDPALEESKDVSPIQSITIDSEESEKDEPLEKLGERNTENQEFTKSLQSEETNFIKLVSSSDEENKDDNDEDTLSEQKNNSISDNEAVTEAANVPENEKSNEIIKEDIQVKRIPRFKVDLKKYESNFQSSNPLSKLGWELKNSAPFRDHLRQMKKKEPEVNDVCGLHGVQLSETEKEPKIESKLKLQSLKSNLKSSADKEVEKLMKQSALPVDMEKEKNCPVFNKSKLAKNKEKKKNTKETAGPGWYNLPKTELTDEVKRDLQVIKMRSTLDSKQHYKRSDSKKFPKFFQMGTIVEGSHEFYSSRMSKKDRKRTMVDELLADAEFRKKNKRRMIEYELKKGAGGKNYHKKKMQKRKSNK